jgi:hypothetical protein
MSYQISDFQYESLDRLANREGSQFLTIIAPISDDDDITKARLTKQQEEAHDLLGLGLIEDKTGSMAEIVTAMTLKSGRDMRVYALTVIGDKMFKGPRKRTVQ